MQRLLILSDLWGMQNCSWLVNYTAILEKFYTIKWYDCLEIGGIGSQNLSENAIHEHFLNGGIETAVTHLLTHESQEVVVLAFSIGGCIGWKAAAKGLKVTHFIALSATRLRFENTAIDCEIVLFYAQNDLNIPSDSWFLDMGIKKNISQNQNHNFYRNTEIAAWVVKKLEENIEDNPLNKKTLL